MDVQDCDLSGFILRGSCLFKQLERIMFMNRLCCRSICFAPLVVAFALVTCTASNSFAGLDWDIARDFSTTLPNPSGAWTYGVYLEDSFNSGYGPWYAWESYQNWAGLPNLAKWGNPGDDLGAGAIFYNPGTEDHINGAQWLKPGEVACFPAAAGGGYAPVIRWTAPADMTVSIEALFTGHDEVSADVHVLLNGDMFDGAPPTFTGTHLFDGIVEGNYGYAAVGIPQTGTSPSQAYIGTISVLAGDKIDFVVGYGPNLWYGGDLTGVSAKITEVPEPGTLVALATGLLCFIGWRRRK
jgi:hypothetical protein